ncbi:MAG: 30S ribosomal protein S8e [Candidatus Aenigmatarchaeota archaeon]
MWHKESRRKISGGKKTKKRKHRKHQLGRETLDCKLADEERRKFVETRGKKNEKTRLRFASEANVTDPEAGKTKKEKIKNVLETPSNPHLARRNILTKGTVVETENGKAKITSRPGQDGQINAVRAE